MKNKKEWEIKRNKEKRAMMNKEEWEIKRKKEERGIKRNEEEKKWGIKKNED